jgi:hypothetical protein
MFNAQMLKYYWYETEQETLFYPALFLSFPLFTLLHYVVFFPFLVRSSIFQLVSI